MDCHFLFQCRKVKTESEVAQSYLTLRDPMDCSLPGSSAHGVFQARVLEWGAIAFSKYYSAFIISSDWMCLQWTVALSPQPRKEDNCYYLRFRVAVELTRACGSTGGCHLLTEYSRKSSPTIPCSPSSYPNDQTHHGAYWCSVCLIV